MGGGSWDAAAYNTAASTRKASGIDDFAYTTTMRATAPSMRTAHDMLDPKAVNNAGDHTGLNVRESLDNDEHPNSVPIAIWFDVTGSMGKIPVVLQTKLADLFGLLLRKGYVEDPQIMMAAIGDAYTDQVPVQVGQFESDNRIDETLRNIFLEHGGGGGNHESYELAIFHAARLTYCDSWEKRGEKGFLFIIGDERCYDRVNRNQVRDHFGVDLEADIPTPSIVDEAAEKWNIYYLFANQGSYQPDQVLPESAAGGSAMGWATLLGQNAMVLDDADTVAEVIALTIGLERGVIDADDGLDHLREIGRDDKTVAAVGKALATIGGGTGTGGGGAVATLDSDLPDTGDSAIERL